MESLTHHGIWKFQNGKKKKKRKTIIARHTGELANDRFAALHDFFIFKFLHIRSLTRNPSYD